MLALINSAVNFVLYCLMSAQFRKTFSQLFCIRWTERVSATGGGNGSGNGTRGFRRGFVRPEATFATELMGTYNETPRKRSDASEDSSTPSKQQEECNNGRSGSGSSTESGLQIAAQETIEMSVAKEKYVQQTTNVDGQTMRVDEDKENPTVKREMTC